MKSDSNDQSGVTSSKTLSLSALPAGNYMNIWTQVMNLGQVVKYCTIDWEWLHTPWGSFSSSNAGGSGFITDPFRITAGETVTIYKPSSNYRIDFRVQTNSMILEMYCYASNSYAGGPSGRTTGLTGAITIYY